VIVNRCIQLLWPAMVRAAAMHTQSRAIGGGGRTVGIPSWMLQSLLVGKSGKLMTKECLTSLVLA
jgi:hypothetical protein